MNPEMPDYVFHAIAKWMIADKHIKPYQVTELCADVACQMHRVRFDGGVHQTGPVDGEGEEDRATTPAKTPGQSVAASSKGSPEQHVPVAEPEPQKRLGGRPKKTTRFYGVPWHQKEKMVKKVKKAKMAKARK
jgi:hypothetical protein